ncbi:MAG: HNH endonuclease [Anaerolineae bacterium]|nr:HNH endonuclease [Anaerolineae bacterium]
MTSSQVPQAILDLIRQLTNKRPRIVAEHILKHGSVTTEELETLYGYKHAPRAARDLREVGIPLETIRVKNADGKTIAAYRFGDVSTIRADRLAGRRSFPKKFKVALINQQGSLCAICRSPYESRYLQIDHRVPYEVIGDPVTTERAIADYMLLCGACNRAKSWSCEHCPNWSEAKNPAICKTCYWATPETYLHVALRNIRRIEMVWDEDEIQLYTKLEEKARSRGEALPAYVKRIIKQHLEDDVDNPPHLPEQAE